MAHKKSMADGMSTATDVSGGMTIVIVCQSKGAAALGACGVNVEEPAPAGDEREPVVEEGVGGSSR
jgi:hypothetical protein